MDPASGLARNSIPWQERPFQTVQAAASIVGLSAASIYSAAAKGQIELKKLGGRTLVSTGSLVSFIEQAEDWSPAPKGGAIVAARSARAAQAEA